MHRSYNPKCVCEGERREGEREKGRKRRREKEKDALFLPIRCLQVCGGDQWPTCADLACPRSS